MQNNRRIAETKALLCFGALEEFNRRSRVTDAVGDRVRPKVAPNTAVVELKSRDALLLQQGCQRRLCTNLAPRIAVQVDHYSARHHIVGTLQKSWNLDAAAAK